MCKTFDVLISYVNCEDPEWLSEFSNTVGHEHFSETRYRSWNTLKYLLRCVETNIPCVNNVILIVSSTSQVPQWLNTNTVRIVYHTDFIPAEYLPTFNSCTIESFLYNIRGLSDKLLYFNDDMFPVGPLTYEDFFVDNKPNLKFKPRECKIRGHIYHSQCRHSADLITNMLALPALPYNTIVTPQHICTPMLRSTLQIVGAECQNDILNTISKLRESRNINQYIYPLYEYFTNNYVTVPVKYKYLRLSNCLTNVENLILHSDYKLLCLNDSGKISDYNKASQKLCSIFETKYPNKSKYEV